MSFAIMRFEKIKSVTSFPAIQRHLIERDMLKNRINIERSDENKLFCSRYYNENEDLFERFKKRTDGIRIRKNAVLALHFVLTYSPDADTFIFDSSERRLLWKKQNMNWLSKTFGTENVIFAHYDADETTRHIHAIVVPIDDRGRLNASHWVDGKNALSMMQDSYAESMKQFGLERGICYTENIKNNVPTRKHKTLKKYYAEKHIIEVRNVENTKKLIDSVFVDNVQNR